MELFFECSFMLLPSVADRCELTLDYLVFLAGVIQLNVWTILNMLYGKTWFYLMWLFKSLYTAWTHGNSTHVTFLNSQSINCLGHWIRLAVVCDFNSPHLSAPFCPVPLPVGRWKVALEQKSDVSCKLRDWWPQGSRQVRMMDRSKGRLCLMLS